MLNGRPVATNVTAAPRPLRPGDTLATSAGTADVMLAPGSLLRLGQDTSVQIVADDTGRAEARLESGRANVAVNFVRDNDLLLVDMPHGQTQMLKRGLYSFDVPSATVRVYNGEAYAFPGANTSTDVKPTKVKEGREVVLSFASLHATDFNRQDAREDLLPWTGPRETRAALADGAAGENSRGYGYNAAYAPASYEYGYGPYGDGFGYPSPYFAYGWPYGFGGYPYGWYGFPWFGVGFGYGGRGFYGRGYGYGLGGGYGVRGGYGLRVGFAGGFAHGGFGGGGFHGGGGRR